MKRTCALIVLTLAGTRAVAELSLAADDAPSDPPWMRPATISYTRESGGSSHANVDAVFRYTFGKVASGRAHARQTTYSLGAYVHRDTSASAPKKDRGVSAAMTQFLVTDFPNDGPVYSFNWNAKASLGQGLQEFTNTAGTKVWEDRTKDRQLLRLSGYYQPKVSGTPVTPDETRRPPMITFFDGSAGVYSDHTRGGDGQGNGRLSGALLGLSANIAPFGIDPSARFNRWGTLGFVPVIRFSAQVQKDLHQSGARTKDTYKLYVAEVDLAFARLSGSGVVPSLVLSRSTGADLLTGRPKSSKTELALGLTF